MISLVLMPFLTIWYMHFIWTLIFINIRASIQSQKFLLGFSNGSNDPIQKKHLKFGQGVLSKKKPFKVRQWIKWLHTNKIKKKFLRAPTWNSKLGNHPQCYATDSTIILLENYNLERGTRPFLKWGNLTKFDCIEPVIPKLNIFLYWKFQLVTA